MERPTFLAFILGSLFTVFIFFIFTPADSATGSAIYNVSDSELTGVNETDYSLLNEAFQSNSIAAYGAECKYTSYIINKTVVKHECRAFYKDDVSIRKVKPTGSMWPNLLGGGYIIVANVTNMSELAVGDIVIVSGSMETDIAHRIVEIGKDENDSYIITKGDNNCIEDGSRFRLSDIEAKVVGILY